jgi:hypothetical protein
MIKVQRRRRGRVPGRGIAVAIGVLTVLAPALPAQQQAAVNDERAVYEAVLKEIFKGGAVPASFVVPAEPRLVPPPSTSQWDRLGAVPTELRTKVASLPATPSPEERGLHKAESFPPGAHIVPATERRDLTSGAQNNGYPEMLAKYQARDLVSFSKPIATADGLDAFVWFGHGCGLLCGTVGYAWLHRASKTDPWTVKILYVAVA